ncbi:hypothetical protein GEO21_18935 [Sphingobacterium faecium]|uniref:hypothetical protein n=1 Tax=Sphingobacterium faecium TaxID=34087 RepID=UPI001290D660|nr:hypothetical protein [Sphingobacterium faecium]MQP29569.1 hypothetical protein [Sphingobacterium faecium]
MKRKFAIILAIGLVIFLGEARGQSAYLNVQDTRYNPSLPSDYNGVLKFNFKTGSAIGFPFITYAYTLGLRGWADDSGGPSHEFAFLPDKLYLRSGTTGGGWKAWRELLISNTAGNYGIGTETPGEKLDIANGYLKIGNTSYGNYEQSSPRNYSTFGGDGHGSLIVGSNVMIENLSTNFSKLKIANSHQTMAGAAIVIPGNGQNNQGSIIFHTSAPAVTQADKPFDSPRMIIDAAGNVGIGTISPQELLSVKGNIRAHQIKVETANWPDYVFHDDYNLKSLDFVEKFIQSNGHLPDVPKAEIVEKDGYSLNEMDKILLKKIEELTLYLIQEKKSNAEQLAKLEKEIETLKKSNK